MIAVKYILFAIISTLLNLSFQYVSFNAYEGMGSLYVAMFLGTLAGLVSKYILDKRYIFKYVSKGKSDDAVKFILYTLMGASTTAIFWGAEIAFDAIVGGEYAKYIGATIGLSIGYVTKYFLDKRFVFKVDE